MGRPERVLHPGRSALDRFGYELRRLRKGRRYSLARLARLVYVSPDLIQRIEIAERRPTQELAARLDKALGAGGFLLERWDEFDAEGNLPESVPAGGEWPGRAAWAGFGALGPWTVAGTLASARDISEVNLMDRRSFVLLTGAVLTAPAHGWLLARPVNDVSSSAGREIGADMMEHLDEMTARLRRLDDQMGGGSLIDVVGAQARYVAGLLRDCRYTDSVGRRLHGTLGELLRLGGWVSFDGGDDAQAQRFWLAALHASHTAGDRGLGANVLGFMSEHAWSLGNLREADTLAQSALAGYKAGGPRVSAILHMRRPERMRCWVPPAIAGTR